MSKWSDYGISAVKYNSQHTHIVSVKIHAITGSTETGISIGASKEHVRSDIVDAIAKNITFVTILYAGNNKWRKGQPVFVVRINGQDYIKTVDNSTTIDNLEDLPEF